MTFHLESARRLLLALMSCVAAAAAPAAAQKPWRITLGREDSLDIGMIHNAPNGHISYQTKDRLTLWVDGRVYGNATGPKSKANSTQGTFILHPASWSIPDLQRASAVNVYHGVHDATLPCTADSAWYRDYAAINSIIPGPTPGQLLAFVDGEFHPLHTGNPLRASIGVATSTDGVTWVNRRVIVQGNDIVAAKFNCGSVDATMKTRADNEGAAGPSAVVRSEGNTKYIYLYYLDRVRLQPNQKPTSDIYVARALYAGGGAPGTWQFWTGKGWSGPGAEAIAKPVVTTPAGGGEAAHPQVTYNTALKRWLMIFHSRADLYATSSEDGTTWDTPQALGASTRGARSPAFPTLVTPTAADQQTTGDSGMLFYSREVTGAGPNANNVYLGFVRSFTVTTTPGGVRKPPCGTPRDCCEANGGTWSGGRCG